MSEEVEPKSAVEAEATDEPGTDRVVEFDGEQWTVTVDGDGWPLEAGLAFSEILAAEDDVTGLRSLKHVATFVEVVVGPAQWRRFQRKPGRRVGDLGRFFQEITHQAYGFQGPGE
jgi:hypothetical protein